MDAWSVPRVRMESMGVTNTLERELGLLGTIGLAPTSQAVGYNVPEAVGGSESYDRLNFFLTRNSIAPKPTIQPLFYLTARTPNARSQTQLVIAADSCDHSTLQSLFGPGEQVRRASLGLIVSCFGERPNLYEDIDGIHETIHEFKRTHHAHDLVVENYNHQFGKNIQAPTEEISAFQVSGSPVDIHGLHNLLLERTTLPGRRYMRGLYFAMEFSDGARAGFKPVIAPVMAKPYEAQVA